MSRCTRKVEHLTGEGLTALRQLQTEYRVLPQPAQPTSAHAFLDAILAKPEKDLSWEDRYNFERALLEVLPEGHIRRMAWSIRDVYRTRVGLARATAYDTSKPPDPASGPVEDLRRDMAEQLSELQWFAIRQRSARGLRSRLSRNAWLLTLFLCAVVFGYTIYSWAALEGHLYSLPFVLLSGALGGTVSAMRRIQTTNLQLDPDVLQDIRGTLTISTAPLIGMIGALLMYLFFVANILRGPLFPTLSPAGDDPGPFMKTFAKFLWRTGPTHAADYAKAILWGFVAGFSEGLVPDLLDWLGRNARATTSAQSTPPASGKPG